MLLATGLAHGQDSVCSVVRIQIQQELTLERQAFDAHMRIVNGLDTTELQNVHINVWFEDADGNPVLASSDPDNTQALFFIMLDHMTGVTGINGTGVIAPGAQADIYWLIIPSPGAGGQTPEGLLYQVGATLSYSFGGESETVNVAPDFIQVRPMPRLELDYFLPHEVLGEDPLTEEQEPSIPFDLGVRITNSGHGAARNLNIESAQPQIVDNAQGLPIHFELLSTQVNDEPAVNSLLAEFGDLPANSGAIAIWKMTTSLYGHFISFDADYYHSDALGGAMTSLIERVDAHTLVRTVRNDLPGRDSLRDFLARDGDTLRLYESEGVDTVVTDRSADASLALMSSQPGFEFYSLEFPPASGPVYSVLPDPTDGKGTVVSIWRSDGKQILDENHWQAPTKATGEWVQELHLFDTNTTGQYEVTFAVELIPNRPPELAPVEDRIVTARDEVSIAFMATDPDEDALHFTLEPMPEAASLIDDSAGNALLTWLTDDSDVGEHDFTISVSDGEYQASEMFRVTVLEHPEGSILVEANLPLETSPDDTSASFTLWLDKEPDAEVWIPLASSDDRWGVLDIEGVLFTPDNWHLPQTVLVHGVGSEHYVGDQVFEIVIGPSESADENFDGLSHEPLPAINRDSGEATILVSPTSGLATAGEGTVARFDLRLNGPPVAPVAIVLGSSHGELGRPEPATATIEPEQWDQPITVEIHGQPLAEGELDETLYLVDVLTIETEDDNFIDAVMQPIEVIHRAGPTWGLEAGSVELLQIEEESDWIVVEFDQPFREVPVVVWLSDDGEVDPAAVRIRNVTTESFEAIQVEPPAAHGLTAATVMHYLAVEPGVHPLPGGGLIEAGLVLTDGVQNSPGFGGPPHGSWQGIEFEGEFEVPPALLAGIQTLDNEMGLLPNEASQPWFTVAVSGLEIEGALLALERSGVTAGQVTVPETIGYLAISWNESTFATGVGWADWQGSELPEPAGAWRRGCEPSVHLSLAPEGAVLLAHQFTRNNNHGGWLRLCRDEDELYGLVFDQDIERNPNRGIHAEDIRALWLSRPFHTRLPGFPENDQ